MTDLSLNPGEEHTFLQRRSLREEVFQLLHTRIVAGKYTPGEWLRQEDIASQLGVSQTPVREALDQLVSVGLAERVPYRGVRVPELSGDQIVDAYVLRLHLEVLSARLAARHASPAQIQALKEIVEKTKHLVTLEEMSKLRQLNKIFHLLVAEASGNMLLTKLYEMASNTFPDWMLYEYMFRHPELLPSSLEKEYREHHAIVMAISAQDANLATRHTAEHIRNLGRELVDYLGVPGNLLQDREQQIAPLLGLT